MNHTVNFRFHFQLLCYFRYSKIAEGTCRVAGKAVSDLLGIGTDAEESQQRNEGDQA